MRKSLSLQNTRFKIILGKTNDHPTKVDPYPQMWYVNIHSGLNKFHPNWLYNVSRQDLVSDILSNNNLKCLVASISTQPSLTFIIEKSYGRYHETRKFRKCHKEKWQAFYYILSPKTCLFSSVALWNVANFTFLY